MCMCDWPQKKECIYKFKNPNYQKRKISRWQITLCFRSVLMREIKIKVSKKLYCLRMVWKFPQRSTHTLSKRLSDRETVSRELMSWKSKVNNFLNYHNRTNLITKIRDRRDKRVRKNRIGNKWNPNIDLIERFWNEFK